MSLKSRILRILLVVVVVVAFAGYFAFSTFLFNPMEGAFEADVAALIPRDVDYFAAKSDVDEIFDPFPRPKVMDRLEKLPAWTTWISSPEYKDLARELDLEKQLATISASLKQIPLGMQPLEIFGRSDLAVAGYFNGRDLAQADWAVYGRVNWAGKLAASALAYPRLLGLEKQGVVVAIEGDQVKLSGPALPRELYLTRIRDVVIVSTRAAMIKAAHDLLAKQFADSLHQSANYFDHIVRANRTPEKDEFEVYVNARKLLENLSLSAAWPDPKSQDFAPAFLGHLFQIATLKDVTGVIGFDQGMAVDLHGSFSSELITPEQAKFYRTRSFDQQTLLNEAARLAPRDTALFAYVHGRIGDLLRQMLNSAEPALRQNLEVAFRNTGKYQSLEQLVKELDLALKDRMVLIVRPNDYPPDPDGPPHNDDPVPAAALILWTQDVEAISALRELIGSQGSKFGLQGRKANEPGYFKNAEAGFETREFWSQFVPGTGIIATGNAGELTIITNSLGMLGHIIKTYTQGGAKYPRLSEESRFEALVQSSVPRGNVLLWANPKTAAPILRQQAKRVAEDSVRIDWKLERARVEDQVLREQFPGKKRGALTPEVQTELDQIVEPKLKSLESRIKAEQVPAMMARQERLITYMEAATSALFMLALDPKSFDLSVRITVPLTAE